MKIIKNILILFVAVAIVAPMIHLFLSTFFSSDAVFYIAILGALTVGYRGFKEDMKNDSKV